MSFQSTQMFDLLDFLSFSLSDYLQSKLSFLEVQMISSSNQQSHFDIVLDFSMAFIGFVRKILISNGFRKPASYMLDLINQNFIDELSIISNPRENNVVEKPICKLLRTKINKISAYKFQLIMRFLYLKSVFESEMILKEKASSSPKQKLKKELIKLLDLVRINMQIDNEDFLSFYLNKVFQHVKDSNSLNFHNFLIEISKISELPAEIHELCKENLEALKKRAQERNQNIAKIPENILNYTNNHQIDQNSTEKTISTLMNDDLFKYSFPTSLSNFIEKDYIDQHTKIIPETVKNLKKADACNSPNKTNFSMDPTRKKMFNDLILNNIKNKNNPHSLIHQNKTNNAVATCSLQIPEESDSRSSSMISTVSNHIYENPNKNLNNSMIFNKPKNIRSFGSTFGRKMVQLPLTRKNSGVFQKKNSIFDHFIAEVNEKLMERQLSKETCNFFQKSLNIKNSEEDDNSSDLPDLLSWNNVVAFNTPIKDIDYKNKNYDDIEIMSYKSFVKEIN